jgi:hypothetical protein
MIIKRRSPFTGSVMEWDIPVTEAQLKAWKGGELIQRAMPNLTPDQREFIMTGLTPTDWEKNVKE